MLLNALIFFFDVLDIWFIMFWVLIFLIVTVEISKQVVFYLMIDLKCDWEVWVTYALSKVQEARMFSLGFWDHQSKISIWLSFFLQVLALGLEETNNHAYYWA